MCPFCIGGTVLLAGSVMSTSGLTALVLKFRRKLKMRNSFQNPDPSPKPKEETWEK